MSRTALGRVLNLAETRKNSGKVDACIKDT
jgi:hypothetical protein